MSVKGPQYADEAQDWDALVDRRYEVSYQAAGGDWYVLDTGLKRREAHFARLEWDGEARALVVRAVECASGEETLHWLSGAPDGSLACTCIAATKGRHPNCYHRALCRAWLAWREALRQGIRKRERETAMAAWIEDHTITREDGTRYLSAKPLREGFRTVDGRRFPV